MIRRITVNPLKLFKPRPTISDQELTTGLRWLTLEGMVSLGFNSITTSGFLAAFALALGANNLQIGILAATTPFYEGPLCQAPWFIFVLRCYYLFDSALTSY